MKAKPHPKVAEIRRRIDHPIVDADAHQLETVQRLRSSCPPVKSSSQPPPRLGLGAAGAPGTNVVINATASSNNSAR